MNAPVDATNRYTQMQRSFYDAEAPNMAVENHRGHDNNPDYWNVLLGAVQRDPTSWAGKRALDIGCGAGRNVANLAKLAAWEEVAGGDISEQNIAHSRRFLNEQGVSNYALYTTSGVDLQPIPSARYDFIMSTIVLQHIAVWQIRHQIFKDVLRVARPGALFSFQMTMYPLDRRATAGYFDNIWDAPGTNGGYDVNVPSPDVLEQELVDRLGFERFRYTLRPEWNYIEQRPEVGGNTWIFVEVWTP